MLGDSSSAGLGSSSGDASAAAAAEAQPTETAHDGGGSGGGGGGGEDERIRGDELGDRSFTGNRWPRQETIALLKIRSDMDVTFRDASVKGPLWEEVSRKLAELGYHRSAKKCKEKFENVYKYHKRTKEGRTGKPDSKTYRFFDQLQALENQLSPFASPPQAAAMATQPKAQTQATTKQASATAAATPAMAVSNNQPLTASQINNTTTTITVPSVCNTTTNISSQGTMNLTFSSPPFQAAPTNPTINFSSPPLVQGTTVTPPPLHSISMDLLSEYSTSSSTSSDDELEEGGGARRKRKRKWKDFFERLMKEVIHRQEELQKRFLEAIEKREHDRMAREEAWRLQEMTRINREREILAQERSMAAAKDAAVMAFLQKISDQQNIPNISIPNPTPAPVPNPAQNNTTSVTPVISIQTPPPPPPPLQPVPVPVPAPPPVVTPVSASTSRTTQLANIDVPKPDDNNNRNLFATTAAVAETTAGVGASSSRWPKVEVHALIKLRTRMDSKYQENGPKGPLWEEISEAMRRLGYNRNAKRCKEKWENINKYFKKVKESNKRRPEDSKTCPYFHQLEALYREKNMKFDPTATTTTSNDNIITTSHHHHHQQQHQFAKSEINAVPLMVQPEQQWPPPPHLPTSTNQPESAESDQPMDQNEDDEEEEDEDEEEDEEGGDNYELVANKPNTNVNNAAAE